MLVYTEEAEYAVVGKLHKAGLEESNTTEKIRNAVSRLRTTLSELSRKSE